MRFHLNLEQLRMQAEEQSEQRRASGEELKLSAVKLELARHHGFSSWPRLEAHVNGSAVSPEAVLQGGMTVATSPVEALYALVERGLIRGGPSGRHAVARSHITLTRIGCPQAPTRPPETIEIDGPMFTVDRETVEIVKHRETRGRHLFAVSFEVVHNPQLREHRASKMRVVVTAPIEKGGWRAFLGAGIATWIPPRLQAPHVTLGQHWSADNRGFCGGARIARGEADVALARLRFTDGSELDADVEQDIAIFFGECPLGSTSLAAIELRDTSGRIVANRDLRPRFPRFT